LEDYSDYHANSDTGYNSIYDAACIAAEVISAGWKSLQLDRKELRKNTAVILQDIIDREISIEY